MSPNVAIFSTFIIIFYYNLLFVSFYQKVYPRVHCVLCFVFIDMFQLLQKYCTLVEVAVCCVEVNFILKCNWFHKMVSPMGRCLIFLVTIRRILYETTFTTLSVLRNSICYREVSAIIHVCYKEVSLYEYISLIQWNSNIKIKFSVFEKKMWINSF